MKFTTKEPGSGVPFARKAPYEYDGVKYDADLKNGDIITILDAGTTEQGQWGEQHNFRVKTRNGEKKMGFNQATINVMIDAFGDESSGWVNKDVKIIIKKDVIGGKKVDIAYAVVDGWELDEYGQLKKLGAQKYEDDGYPINDGSEIPF